MGKKNFNEYKILNNDVVLFLPRRSGEILEACIDLDEFQKVKDFEYRWHTKLSEYSNTYYAVATKYLGYINNKPKYKPIYLHQLILDYDPKIFSVDHKNKNGLDNRKQNLRLIDKKGNAVNRKRENKNSTSGYRNVSWIEGCGKWVVQLQIEGKNTKLGEFDDVDEAGRFAERMRQTYYKEYIPSFENAKYAI